VAEARRRGVQAHKVPGYVRRRLGGGVAILRFRADGSPGCSAPCTLCARELLKYDLKVACLLESGEVFMGRLTDPGAPPSKITGGQRAWLTYWTASQRARRGSEPEDGAGAADGGGPRAASGDCRTANSRRGGSPSRGSDSPCGAGRGSSPVRAGSPVCAASSSRRNNGRAHKGL
jgi:hypothetical protein